MVDREALAAIRGALKKQGDSTMVMVSHKSLVGVLGVLDSAVELLESWCIDNSNARHSEARAFLAAIREGSQQP